MTDTMIIAEISPLVGWAFLIGILGICVALAGMLRALGDYMQARKDAALWNRRRNANREPRL
jgi:hypothetical protein